MLEFVDWIGGTYYLVQFVLVTTFYAQNNILMARGERLVYSSIVKVRKVPIYFVRRC